MSGLYILRTYAQKNPSDLPASILFSHSSSSLTIYDAFPKSIFHFLILPRVPSPFQLSLSDLSSLKSLLKCDKDKAKSVLMSLNEDAATLKTEIEAEMVNRFQFKWPIWVGFHGDESMEHLHLHVLSADLCSPRMKNKKHYNSFNPQLGFFLHLDDVLSWFDAEPSYFASMAKLDPKPFAQLLKEDLSCWRCGSEMKNIPKLKEHIQEEWDRDKAKHERKRKLEQKTKANADDSADHEQTKKQKTKDTETS